MKHITILFILSILFDINIYAQTEPLFPNMMSAKTIDFPTPNAGTLGKYGQVPVNYYNGLVNIAIPIYKIKLRDIEIPITLQYYAGGNKPDEHPGWVGLGWNLQAGGCITRIVKGRKDEALRQDLDHFYISLDGTNRYGFFYQHNLLNTIADWNDKNYLINIMDRAVVNHYDTEPDEFTFNFAGITGSFFFTSDPQTGGTITKVQCKQPVDLKIECSLFPDDIQTFTTFNDDPYVEGPTVDVTKPFIRFIITDSNGIKYTFGATGYGSYNDPTQSSISYTSTLTGKGSTTTPTTWNITSIESPHGEFVHFTYDRNPDILINQRCGSRYKVIGDPNSHYPDPEYDDNIILIHPSYLKKIIASNSDTIEFTTSKSNELKYQYGAKSRESVQVFASNFGNKTLDSTALISRSGFLKLDQLTIRNRMNIKFNYIENLSERLKLESLKISFAQKEQEEYGYLFQYNQTKLPLYNAKKSDKWGYFNNIYYGSEYMANINDSTAIERKRQPDPAFMEAEMLTRIDYPTGGYTSFEYEPHDYSQVMKKFAVFSYKLNSDTIFCSTPYGMHAQNGICGGVRIKKITDSPNAGSNENDIIRTFSYKQENGSSSGILSIEPAFWRKSSTARAYDFAEIGWGWFGNKKQEGNSLEILQISENILNPLNSLNGAPVTYSRVIESFSNGSKSVYTYTNHQDFMDEPALPRIENILNLTLDEAYISKELERGLLKSATHYTNAGDIVSKTEYKYNNDTTRYDNYIKSIAQKILPYKRGDFWRLSAQKIYTFCPYVIKEIRYNGAGSGSQNYLMDTELNYKYDNKNRVIERSTTNSNGNIHKTTYEYPDNVSDSYSALKEHHMYPVIRQTEYVNNEVTEVTSNEYEGINLSKTNIGRNANNLEPRIIYSYHDSKGNPGYIEKDGKPEAIYIWGYNRQYPIAEIKNVTYERFSSFISAEMLEQIGSRNIPSVSQWQTINRLRYDLPEALVTTYTYKPGIGITSKTDPRGIKTAYIYDLLGRLTDIKDHEGNVIKHYDYQYATQSQDQ